MPLPPAATRNRDGPDESAGRRLLAVLGAGALVLAALYLVTCPLPAVLGGARPSRCDAVLTYGPPSVLFVGLLGAMLPVWLGWE